MAPDGRRRRSARLLIVLPWLVIALAALPLALISTRSQIQLTVAVSQAQLTLARAAPEKIAASFPTNTLTLSGFRSALLGFGRFDSPVIKRSGELRLAPADSFTSATFENVTVSGVQLSSMAVLTLSWHNGELKVDARDARVEGSFTPKGPLVIRCDGCTVTASDGGQSVPLPGRSTFVPNTTQLLSFDSGTDGMAFTLDAPQGSTPLLGSIGLRQIDFSDLQGAQPESSILSGEVVHTRLRRDPRAIKEREFVIADGLDNFWLTQMKIGEGGMELNFSGEVDRLAIGPAGAVENDLPSLLEWIYAQQRWILYVQAIAVAATTLIGALRILRVLPEL